MRICPKCRAPYPLKGRSTCEKDGTRLVDTEEFARSQSDPLIGRSIGGRFKVIERIGTGGMGTVYRAAQTGLDRHVALKVLKRELVSDRDTVARFHREAKAMSMLMHPNSVRVFDFGEDDDGYLYLAMELLEGELLTAWIEREGAPPVDQAVRAAQEVLRSLAEAHSKGIIHRDLKPDNIFLARVEGHARPVVKVLDFGIAKIFRDDRKIDQLETQAGTVFGTPRYMSPEQAQGKPLDHRSDLYSVGVLLYQLLTGRPPFIDDDAVVVMAKHIRDTPDTPREAAPDRPIPRSLEKVCMRALAKEPEQRFDSADEFEARLGSCFHDVYDEADRRGGKSSGFLGSLRLPLAIGGGIVMVAVLLAVALVASSYTDDIAEAHNVARLPADDTAPSQAPPPDEPIEREPLAIGQPAIEQPAQMASVTLRSDPEGAEVWWGDRQVGTTPHTFAISDRETLRLTLRAPGRSETDVELTSDVGPTFDVALAPEPDVGRAQRRERPIPVPEIRPLGPAPNQTTPPVSPRNPNEPYERFEF